MHVLELGYLGLQNYRITTLTPDLAYTLTDSPHPRRLRRTEIAESELDLKVCKLEGFEVSGSKTPIS